MKTILILLTLLFSLSSMAAIVGNQNGLCKTCIEIDGKIIDKANANIKKVSFATTGAYFDAAATIVDASSVWYTPAASTKAVLLGVKLFGDTGAANIALLYTNSPTNNSPTTPDAPVVYCGQGGGVNPNAFSILAGSFENKAKIEGSCSLVIPSGKYFHLKSSGVINLTADAYIGECSDTGACEFDNF